MTVPERYHATAALLFTDFLELDRRRRGKHLSEAQERRYAALHACVLTLLRSVFDTPASAQALLDEAIGLYHRFQRLQRSNGAVDRAAGAFELRHLAICENLALALAGPTEW